MPGQTTNYNIPYPIATDLVVNGPTTIQSLADTVDTVINTLSLGSVPTSRTISPGNGLTGGGSLASNISLAVDFGTGSNQACAGNDSRVVNAVQPARQVLAGTGLSGGGNLGSDVTISANFGTVAGTICQGNDSRVVSAVQPARQIIAGSGLTGGGDLSLDRTLSIDYATAAADAEFSNRYVSITNAIWLPVGAFNIDTGTRVIVNDATDAIEMAESVDSYAVASVRVPSVWTNAQIRVLWANAGAGSGDVVWTFNAQATAVGADISAINSLSPNVTTTAGAQDILVATVSPSFATSGGMVRIKISRGGTSGSDTLANEVNVIGAFIEQA